MTVTGKKHRFSIYSFFIWGLAILFFLYEFFLRVLPATFSNDIIFSLDISLEEFALVGSAYYITYSVMQVPVGILLDRFPVKTVVTVGALLCSLGALWFTFAHSFLPAFIARLLIGAGSAFGFITLIIVTLNWFPKKYFAFMLGWGQFIGALGPFIAGGPIALLLALVKNDWRIIFFYVALFGIGLTFLIGVFIKGKPTKKAKVVFVDKGIPIRKRVSKLLSEAQIWWTLLYAGTIYVALPLLGAFWGTAYLEARGFDKPTAAFIVSMIWFGLAIGSPFFGRLSDMHGRRKPLICTLAVIGAVSSALILFFPIENTYFLSALFFMIGIASSGQNISFAIITENAPKKLRATALAMNNMSIMGMAALIPPLATAIIRHFSVEGVYSRFAFEKGLLVIPTAFSLALLVGLFGIRETFCRHRTALHHLKNRED